MKKELEQFATYRCAAILRTPHKEAVKPALKAAVDGGFRIIECTLNTPGALSAIMSFAGSGDVLVGAGTVLSIEDAKRSVDAGARFLVSPVADVSVISWAVENQILVIPGCATPTEMFMATRAGAPICKFFPAPGAGPDTLKVILGPLPNLRIFPTSGVTLDNATSYLSAGAFGVGFVNCLFDPELVANGEFKIITQRAQHMIQAVARGGV